MKNVNLFIINGAPRSGKDTFANLVTAINCSDKEVVNLSSVDDVKIAAGILGWDGTKTVVNRQFLSDLKQLSENFNSHSVEKIVKLVNDNKDSIVYFYHVREDISIRKIKQSFNGTNTIVKTVYVDRLQEGKEEVQTNISDIQSRLNPQQYDIVIDNSGTKEELIQSAKMFCEKYLEIC